MDTGPQKESDPPQEARTARRERERERKKKSRGTKAFKAKPERQVGKDSNTDRGRTANTANSFAVVKIQGF